MQPHSIVLYKSFPASLGSKPGEASLLNLDKGTKGEYNGYLSPATSRKIKRYLSNWLLALQENMKGRDGNPANKYYPTFVTLTLPSAQSQTDNEVKRKLLDRFILQIKKSFGVKHYFWRAEPQGNGNIHFHLIVDRWMSWEKLRAEWNKVLDCHGYLSAYRKTQEEWHKNGFRPRKNLLSVWPMEKQKAAYLKGKAENWSNPNTTDVHKIQNLDSITAYVVKYVCKKSDLATDRKIEGRIWGCSDELRNFSYYVDTHSIEMNYQQHGNAEIVDYVAQVEQELGAGQVFEDEFIKVIRLKDTQEHYLSKYAPKLKNRYRQYYQNIYKQLYGKHQKELVFEQITKEVENTSPKQAEIVQMQWEF